MSERMNRGLALALLAAAMAGGGCGPPLGEDAAASPAAASAAVETIPGVDLSPLEAAQQRQAIEIFRENGCDCGCGMTVYTCRREDPNCGRSPQLAAAVVRELAAGRSPGEVVRAVFSPAAAAGPDAPEQAASGEMVFPVEAGDSFAVGPADATVTLISFLDYQ